MSKLFWIKCDIDGQGQKWRFAYNRGEKLYFVEEDFEDSAEGYQNYPRISIENPNKEDVLTRVQAECKDLALIARLVHTAYESNVNRTAAIRDLKYSLKLDSHKEASILFNQLEAIHWMVD